MSKKRKAKWSARNNSKACATMGWAIFDGDTLCRDDEQAAFASDNDAMRFVGAMAQDDPETGKPANKLAAKVLAYLDRVNPKQAACIRSLGGYSS